MAFVIYSTLSHRKLLSDPDTLLIVASDRGLNFNDPLPAMLKSYNCYKLHVKGIYIPVFRRGQKERILTYN